MTRRQALAAGLAGLAVLGLWTIPVTRMLSADDTPGVPPLEVLGGVLFFGWPFALATAILVVAGMRTAVGPDGATRVLALATAGAEHRTDWPAAMRAELASITDPAERRRFAAGCLLAVLRTGVGRAWWLTAAGTAGALALVTFAVSRASLSSVRGGDWVGGLGPVLWGSAPLAILAVAATAAARGRSLRRGLALGVAALVGTGVGVLAVAVPEGATWAREVGVYLLDLDAPKVPLTPSDGALDALWSTTFWGLLFWLPWPVLGAALGRVLAGVSAARRVAPTLPARDR